MTAGAHPPVVPPPEFSRPERIDAIGERERMVAIEADADERAALARRFGLVAIGRLTARLSVRRDASGILVSGRVSADVTQACVVTGAPIPATVDEAMAVRFVETLGEEPEVELDGDALDIVEIEGGSVDLGEAAAETMALALDPFPRAPDAAEALARAGVGDGSDTGPFGALAALRGKL